MPSGVRETIKLWTQPGTSSEPSVGVIYGMGWDGMGWGWVCVCVCGGELLEEMTKGSPLSGGTQAIVLWHCAHEDPSQQSFESSVLTLIHYHH